MTVNDLSWIVGECPEAAAYNLNGYRIPADLETAVFEKQTTILFDGNDGEATVTFDGTLGAVLTCVNMFHQQNPGRFEGSSVFKDLRSYPRAGIDFSQM